MGEEWSIGGLLRGGLSNCSNDWISGTVATAIGFSTRGIMNRRLSSSICPTKSLASAVLLLTLLGG